VVWDCSHTSTLPHVVRLNIHILDVDSMEAVAVEAAGGMLLSALGTAQGKAQALRDAVRGARHEQSMWYKKCKALGDSCHQITPLLESLEDELQTIISNSRTKDAVLATVRDLSGALQDGEQLVQHCRRNSVSARVRPLTAL
jgi:hypothetical protein